MKRDCYTMASCIISSAKISSRLSQAFVLSQVVRLWGSEKCNIAMNRYSEGRCIMLWFVHHQLVSKPQCRCVMHSAKRLSGKTTVLSVQQFRGHATTIMLGSPIVTGGEMARQYARRGTNVSAPRDGRDARINSLASGIVHFQQPACCSSGRQEVR
jgi:hypothetical protein